ncbi:MAG TPA: PEP-CTERM sorting domain-containing protein [Candidatus Methylacidiphilales bacterium]|nr:PEP-CTERM sorting domain-containing protein [Candidatus Methylacidiphilales bacterium]
MKKYLLFAFLAVFILPARANFTAFLDAGQLTGPSGVTSGPNAMQIGGSTPPSGTGSLVLLIDIGSASSANTSIYAGSYVGTGDTILAATGFNENSGNTNEMLSTLSNISGGTTGDNLAILWFPQITYNQYESATQTVAGDYFGTYTPSPVGEVPTDGGNAWVVPSAGSDIDLFFFTSNDFGGAEPNSDGYANNQVLSSVPEPSTIAMVGFAGAVFLLMSVRRLRTQAAPARV